MKTVLKYILLSLLYSKFALSFDCPSQCTCSYTVLVNIVWECNQDFPTTFIQNLKIFRLFNSTFPILSSEQLKKHLTTPLLRELSFCNGSINNIAEFTFLAFPNLEILRISDNRLMNLTQNIFNGLSQLKYLYLDHNVISVINPYTFSYLKNLQLLSLENNRLLKIPENLPMTLKDLNLNKNSINELLVPIFKLPRLITLLLLDNKYSTFQGLGIDSPILETLMIGGDQFTDITDSAAIPSTVTVLTLKSCIEPSENLFHSLRHEKINNLYIFMPLKHITSEMFKNIPALRELYLSNIGNEVIVDVDAFKWVTYLYTLNLEQSPFLVRSIIYSPKILKILTNLRSLSLKNSNIQILNFTENDFPYLQELDISKNPLHCDYSMHTLIRKLYIRQIKVLNSDQTICSSPQIYQGTNPKDINYRNLPSFPSPIISIPQPGFSCKLKSAGLRNRQNDLLNFGVIVVLYCILQFSLF